MPDNNGHGDGNGGKPDGEFDGKTYLYIRTNPADTGAEPLPAGLKHWTSPDIVVIKPGGAVGTEAVAEQTNQVQVTVTNAGGLDAVDAYVDVFFANPSTGFTPATATPIGGTYVTISGYSTGIVQLPWVPAATDAGHRCLLARVALYIPPDLYTDGTIFDVKGDRHVAQRNISVVALQRKKSLSFSFLVVNPLERSAKFRLVAREVRGATAQARLRAGLGCPLAQFGEKPLSRFSLAVGRQAFLPPGGLKPAELLEHRFALPATGLVRRATPSRLRRSHAVEMRPGEAKEGTLFVERNSSTRRGDVHALDVIQTDDQGTIVGGLTLIVVH